MIGCLKWFMKIQFIFIINLGNALTGKLLQLNQIQRNQKSKAIKVTPNGKKKLKQIFSIDIS